MAVASPLDFTLDCVSESSVGTDKWPAPAYCLTHAQERMLCAICPDSDGLFEAPFLWQAQYQRASHIASIPFERLHEFPCTVPRKPIFVFSIGRCGSTLLSAILRACGAHSVSEPDLLTQLAVTGPEEGRRMGKQLRSLLIESCIASLATQRGAPIAIKFRSQCNGIAREIAQIFPDGTYAVMMRDRHAWLSSRLRTLGGDPKVLASRYRRGLQTFHELQSMRANAIIIWYEDLISDPTGTVRQLMSDAALSHSEIPDLGSIMNLDSQAGTVLEKNNPRRKGPTPEEIQIFDDEWEKIRPDMWIESYARDRLRSGSQGPG